jgi:hypothetical protein
MHCLSLIYFTMKPLHVSGIFIAHHQAVFTVYVRQLVCVISLSNWQLVGSGRSSTPPNWLPVNLIYNTYQLLYKKVNTS